MAPPDPRPSHWLIAIETSTAECSVALAREVDGRLSCEVLVERAQEPSRRLLVMVESLLGGAGLTASSLAAIAFDAGPGSFTGLRIGCGVAQGIGFAVSVPLVGVSSLEVLATAALSRRTHEHSGRLAGKAGATAPADQRLVLAAIDARMGQVYCGVYRQSGERAQLVGEIAVCDPLDAIARFEDAMHAEGNAARALPAIAAGEAFSVYARLAEWVERGELVRAKVGAPDAGTLARIGLAKLGAGETVPAWGAVPIYVRDKVALDVREQRALRAGATG